MCDSLATSTASLSRRVRTLAIRTCRDTKRESSEDGGYVKDQLDHTRGLTAFSTLDLAYGKTILVQLDCTLAG